MIQRRVRISTFSLLLGVGLAAGCGGDPGPGADASSNNQSSALCGNDLVEAAEECDEGAANSDVTPDACRTDCRRARCGDGVTDQAEACDDGLYNSDALPNACRVACLTPRCGDGVTDRDETCDDGNTTSGDGCSDTCRTEFCGNGQLDPDEICDDGNVLGGDGCSSDCRSDESCGNGIPDYARGELCDDGNTEPGDGCEPNCTLPTCGDGTRDPGEACDDGNTLDGDGCSARCSSDESCGNGIIDLAVGEQCDDGNLDPGDACGAQCRLAYCGNGAVDADEVCDDGNTLGGDGCSADCGSDESCGNGVVDVAAGEACDDGDTQGGDGCSAACLLEYCGNGRVDPGEACDDGDTQGGDGCSADCHSNEACGNGVVDVLVGETCDDGDTQGGDGCSAACTPEPGYTCAGQPSMCSTTCGDGQVAGVETCDDGATSGGDGCTAACQVEPGWSCSGTPSLCSTICGDHLVAGTETCDDGVNDGAYGGCLPGCAALGPRCGDGLTNGAEACDDGVNDGAYGGCMPGCAARAPRCGDGLVTGGVEVCDDGVNSGAYGGCMPGCAALAPRCGDGVVNGVEICDDGVNDGAYGGCMPGCAARAPHCGDGVTNGTEACDDGGTAAGDGCSAGCAVEPFWTCSGSNPTVCSTLCGDGHVRGDEACDDGDLVPGDGCSSTCALEAGWTCDGSEPSGCAKRCDADGDCQALGPGIACELGGGVCVQAGNTCSDTPLEILASGTYAGSTLGFTNSYNLGTLSLDCLSNVVINDTDGPDRVYAVPMAAGEYFQVWIEPVGTPWDPVLGLATGCPITPASCNLGSNRSTGALNDPERLDFVATVDATVYLVVDVDGSPTGGDYVLHVTLGTGVAPSVAPGDLVITEIMPDPTGNDNNCEWFELENRTAGAIDLQGFEVGLNGIWGLINQPLVLLPGELMIFAYEASSGVNCGLRWISWEYQATASINIPKDGGTVAIRDPFDVTIDSVTYIDSPSWPYTDGRSMYLCTNHLDAVDNNTVTNWGQTSNIATFLYRVSGTDSNYGTPGQANPGPCN